ncbi:hypothetical protein [Dethiothermospora halolimnae]|uniref:hypothetical protein n=1 Tax=Dethiothermospora halolimnae TaxID=3114390 RepID=UPI003CCBC47E
MLDYVMLGIVYVLAPIAFFIILMREIKFKNKLYKIKDETKSDSIILKINSNELIWGLNIIVIGQLYNLYSTKWIVKILISILYIALVIALHIVYLTQNFYIVKEGILWKNGFINWEDVISFEIEEALDPFYKHYHLTIKYINEKGKETQRRLNIREKKERTGEIEEILKREIYDN